jgi:hypothetical protein
MDFTLHSTRRDGKKNIYRTSNLESGRRNYPQEGRLWAQGGPPGTGTTTAQSGVQSLEKPRIASQRPRCGSLEDPYQGLIMEAEPVVEKETLEEEVRWEAEPMEVEGG